jgi:hypothetical protein
MQDLASAVLSRRYEEQLFQQASSHNRGALWHSSSTTAATIAAAAAAAAYCSAAVVQKQTHSCSGVSLPLQLCQHCLSPDSLGLAKLRWCSIYWPRAGEIVFLCKAAVEQHIAPGRARFTGTATATTAAAATAAAAAE